MSLSITPLYAGLLTLVFLALSASVIRQRLSPGAASGQTTGAGLERWMRVHANFAEYVPLALVLMLCAELQGAPAVAVHAMGASLLVGRVCHAIGMSRTPQIFILRQIGIVLTFLTLALSALALIGHAVL